MLIKVLSRFCSVPKRDPPFADLHTPLSSLSFANLCNPSNKHSFTMSLPHDPVLNKQMHTKYFLRCLGLLPPSVLPHDSSRTSLAYFCFSALDILGTLDTAASADLRRSWADWVYSNLTASREGFRGSPTHAIARGQGSSSSSKVQEDAADTYDCANIASTYFCILSLAVLRDDRITRILDRDAIAAYVAKCQLLPKDSAAGVHTHMFGGAFAPNYSRLACAPFGEPDSRCAYMATGILRALHRVPSPTDVNGSAIDVRAATDFLTGTRTYEGGLGVVAGAEAHSGYTFCGLATLRTLQRAAGDTERDSREDWETAEYWEKTRRWLLRRQIWPTDPATVTQLLRQQEEDDDDDSEDIGDGHWPLDEQGAHNGRTNKPADTCYSFWSVASLLVLDTLTQDPQGLAAVNTRAATHYLLHETQGRLTGGFARQGGHHADPYHSFLGLAALSMLDQHGEGGSGVLGLKPIVPELCLTKDTADWIDSLQWDAEN